MRLFRRNVNPMNEIPSRLLSTRHLLGRIILAKMLSMSSKRLVEHVRAAEDSPLFSRLVGQPNAGGRMVGLARINLGSVEQRSAADRSTSSHSTAAILRRARLPGARWLQDGDSLPPFVLGVIRGVVNGKVQLYYRDRALATGYEMDATRVCCLLAQSGGPITKDMLRLLHQLRRIDTCNRMTHSVVQALVRRQERYLETGDRARLVKVAREEILNGPPPPHRADPRTPGPHEVITPSITCRISRGRLKPTPLRRSGYFPSQFWVVMTPSKAVFSLLKNSRSCP